GLSTGGAGYGDPLDRTAEAVEKDLTDGTISEWSARHIYGVVLDEQTGRLDAAATDELRAQVMRDRIARGRPYEEFEAEWSQQRPPEEIMGLFGSWPDGAVVTPLMRP
nr:hydantoinase B/oxoprolinase family protein [Geodermatophilaceae bacterium]